MLALTATLLAAAMAGSPSDPVDGRAAGIQLSINSGGDFTPGDRVNVEVDVGDDG